MNPAHCLFRSVMAHPHCFLSTPPEFAPPLCMILSIVLYMNFDMVAEQAHYSPCKAAIPLCYLEAAFQLD